MKLPSILTSKSDSNSSSKRTIEAKKQYPLFSVVTVVYNGAEHLESAIRSVLAQDYPALEYIIIDGGSDDGSVDIIRRYEKFLAHWVSEPDEGIYSAMNKGLRMASGEIIGILNADDEYLDGSLMRVAEESMRGGQIWYGDIARVRLIADRQVVKTFTPNLSSIESQPSLFHPGTFVRRVVYERIGLFDETFRIAADYDFLLRAYKAGCDFRYLDSPVTLFRSGGASSSCFVYIEGYRVLRKNGLPHKYHMLATAVKCCVKRTSAAIARILLGRVRFERLLQSKLKAGWENVRT